MSIVSSITDSFLDVIFNGNEDKGVARTAPKAVILYAGHTEITGGSSASTVWNNYRTAVSR